MSRLVFLLEEYSMKILLEGLLPRLFPDLSFLCISHEGKQDLEKSVPRKLRAWREPGVRFIVLRDNDGGDCRTLKTKLKDLCLAGNREDSLVRIACQELESWYLGEPEAMAEAFNDTKLCQIDSRSRYRVPDDVQRPSVEVAKLVPSFQKVSGARKMASKMSISRNGSSSFRLLMKSVADISDGFSAESTVKA